MDGAVVSNDWFGGLNITYRTGPGYIDKRYVDFSDPDHSLAYEIQLQSTKFLFLLIFSVAKSVPWLLAWAMFCLQSEIYI